MSCKKYISKTHREKLPHVNPLARKSAEVALKASPIHASDGQSMSLEVMIMKTSDDSKSKLVITQNARKKLQETLSNINKLAKTERETEISQNIFSEMRDIEIELLKGNRCNISTPNVKGEWEFKIILVYLELQMKYH